MFLGTIDQLSLVSLLSLESLKTPQENHKDLSGLPLNRWLIRVSESLAHKTKLLQAAASLKPIDENEGTSFSHAH